MGARVCLLRASNVVGVLAPAPQVTSLAAMFLGLKVGGLYIIEDLATSYAGRPWSEGRSIAYSAVEFIKLLLDLLGSRRDFPGVAAEMGLPDFTQVSLPLVAAAAFICKRENDKQHPFFIFGRSRTHAALLAFLRVFCMASLVIANMLCGSDR
jgi:hypothetical protein